MNGTAAGGGSERLSPGSQRVEEWGRESFTPSKRTDTRFQRYLLSLTRFEAWMTDSFGDLGEFVAVNARMVQLATIIFTIVCSLCLWYFMEIETRPEELFVLSGGRSLDELAYVNDVWGAPPRAILLYFTSASGGGKTDVLNAEFMDVASHLHRELETLRTSSNTSFQDLCYLMPEAFRQESLNISVGPASSPCFVFSPLEFWPLPFANLTHTLCSDMSSDLIEQYTHILPAPLNSFTNCDEAVWTPTVDDPRGKHRPGGGVTCETTVPLPQWLLETAGVHLDRTEIAVADMCPQTCGGCPHSAFSQMPTVSVSDSASLQADSRVQQLGAMELDVLAVGCLDAPPSAIAGLSNGLIGDCDSLIRTFCDPLREGTQEHPCGCFSQPKVSSAMRDAAAQATAAALQQYDLDELLASRVPVGYGSNPVCWDGASFTFERCCDLSAGASGDLSCWSGDFTFSACCMHGARNVTDQMVPATLCPLTCGACREGDLLVGTSERAEPPSPPADPHPTRTLPLVTLNAALTLTKYSSNQLLGHRTISENGAIVGATSIRSTYILDCGGRMGGDQAECVELEGLWMDYIHDAIDSGRLGDVRVSYFSTQGAYLESVRAMATAVPLFSMSVAMMLAYICSSLGKWGEMARHSKMFVGMIGTVNVVMSTTCAFGLCCLCGLVITPADPVVYFLLLGIGIDDMFVVVRSVELVPEGMPTEKRLREAMRSCGGSITVTTVTDAVAFLIGATIRFPAMQIFCAHAAVGITLVFVFTCTFVLASLAVSDKGMLGDPSAVDRLIHKARGIDVETSAIRHTMGGTPQQASNVTREFLKKYWAPFVREGSDTNQLAVLGAFALLGWVGLWGAFQMEEGFDILSLLTRDSYITDDYITGEQQFEDVYFPLQLVLRGDTDYADAAERAELQRVINELEAMEWLRTGFSNWVDGYVESRFYDEGDFMSGVPAFLNSEEGLQYSQSVVLDESWDACFAVDGSAEEGEAACMAVSPSCVFVHGRPASGGSPAVPGRCEGKIAASRVDSYFPGDLKDAQVQESLVADVRRVVDESTLDAFIFSSSIWMWEVRRNHHQSPHFARAKAADETELLVQVWSVLVFQLVLNLAETFVAIFIGTNIFLFHPTVSIIICLNVLLVEFELMALCALFSIQLNCNTVVRSQTPLCFGRQRIENNDVVLGVRSASSS